MRNFKLFLPFAFIILTACSHTTPVIKVTPSPATNSQINPLSMKITSTAFSHNERIPSKYTCDGENISPPLEFFDIPQNSKSLVLIMDDPDAPRGTWLHWTVWNISPQTKEFAENSVPENSLQGTTSFGEIGYGGPCPPTGTHRYFFKLYALDTVLDIPKGADLEKLTQAMEGHVLEKAELMGLYERK